ncbi:hypothetical protein OU798_21210 [Prolixibacteraceae bacterium Z1-6]|uniref:Uncharacterized protein n=1 Tax=Draconibacterium aestuarii TaxID=2998507 RepID=A0A9X3J8S9_9BACT|nr:hypothetical protein [Prolixibacteraceae bacterium Z1-6]
MASGMDKMLSKVTWNANGKELVFNRGLQNYSIEVKFLSNEHNELVLFAQLPLTELPIPENKIISVGIETGKVASAQEKGPEMDRPEGMGSGKGVPPPGGMRGGTGGNMGGGAPSKDGSSTSTSPLKIWFKIEL